LPELGGRAAAKFWHASAIAASTAAEGGCLHVNKIHRIGNAHTQYTAQSETHQLRLGRAAGVAYPPDALLHAKSRRLLMLSCHGASAALAAGYGQLTFPHTA
jgi:hypothetical protein